MYRKIQNFLIEWKYSPNRKPLILQGARQVGKTYSVLEFGRANYENVVHFNFETEPGLLSRISHQAIVPSNTLVFFDEIQVCEEALASLKCFCEKMPNAHIIVASSLLGVALNKKDFSFPVSKVDIKTMYPMDMEEFLLAHGEQDLAEAIKKSFESNTVMPPLLHKIAMEYYRKYLMIGGMPECVEKYIGTKNLILIRHLQKSILTAYLNDMSKYNLDNEIQKTRLAYNNIAVQLSKSKTKFQYKQIKKEVRASEFENAIEWLNLSGMASVVFKVDNIMEPLENYKSDAFKIYVSDIGLLCAKKNIMPENILYDTHELDDFKGGLVENFVEFHLRANGLEAYYWESEREAEMDFVIRRNEYIIPVEVKSSDNTKSKKLSVYMQKFKPEYAIKLSTKNFGFENNIKTVPLYAAFCL
ncbi:MAG: DUF4143 domain-containing protein [Fibromonadaceae bacterium]|jgi:predicted AAA+ superfamily ATPase|nr:DUF4143 domain-containing protein [Fibromonadaceae bacterium]